jgi:hypothetical protein
VVPTNRRDWVEAVWAESPEVPPGLRRLAWRAGGVRLIAREAGMARRIGGLMLFAVAAAVAAWAAWPGSSASFAAHARRIDVIAVGLLAGLPLLARWFLGQPDNRAARWLRAGCYAALFAMLPAIAVVDQFHFTVPRGGADLRLYLLITQNVHPDAGDEVIPLVVVGLYLAAMLWLTSRRARIAPATIAAGACTGIALGLVMYAVAPTGLSTAATNPWLPGSDADPLVLLAWLLLLGGPVAAAIVADRRYTASSGSRPPARARARQMMAAGLVTGLVGALSVGAAGYGTTALMIKATWLRDWLYHGQHLLYGVQNLSADLRTLPAIAYSHQITGASDAGAFFIICLAFPLVAFAPAGLIAAYRVDDGASAPEDPRRGGGGPPGPPGPPGLDDPGPGAGQDQPVPALAGVT